MNDHRHRRRRADRREARRAAARPRRRGHHALAQPLLRPAPSPGSRRRSRPRRRRSPAATASSTSRARRSPSAGATTPSAASSPRASSARATSWPGSRPPTRARACSSSSSAVGYYGPHGDEPLDEQAPAGDDFLAEVCVVWEREARRAAELGLRVVCVRTGVVLDQGGGALAKMLPFFKLGVGGPVAGGDQYMPWIHVDDVVGHLPRGARRRRLGRARSTRARPTPVTNKAFSKALGRALHRPALRARARPRGARALRRDGRDRHQGPARAPAPRAGARVRVRAPGPRRGPAAARWRRRYELMAVCGRPRRRRRLISASRGLLALLPRLALVPLRGRVLRRDHEPDQRRRGSRAGGRCRGPTFSP